MPNQNMTLLSSRTTIPGFYQVIASLSGIVETVLHDQPCKEGSYIETRNLLCEFGTTLKLGPKITLA